MPARSYGVRPGDLWRAGPHAFLCDDCTTTRRLRDLTGGEVDAIICDPPWPLVWWHWTAAFHAERAAHPFIADIVRWLRWLPKACPDGPIMLRMPPGFAPFPRREALAATLARCELRATDVTIDRVDAASTGLFEAEMGREWLYMCKKSRGLHLLTFPPKKDAEKSSLARYKDESPTARILDPSCGPATMLAPLAEAGHTVFGIDAFPLTIEAALRRMAGMGHDIERA